MTDLLLSGTGHQTPLGLGSPDATNRIFPAEASALSELSTGVSNQQLPKVENDLFRAQNGENITIRGRNQTVRGTSGDDILDGSRGRKNKIRGLGGNDVLLAGKKDKVVGGGGNDTVDGRQGKAKNTLKGSGGNDEIFARKKDKLLGNGGDDLLNAGGARGKNTLNGGGGDDILIGSSKDDLKGGRGSDEFWIADGNLPKRQLRIRDFRAGLDQIGIRVDGVTQFSDITLTQQGSDTLITVNNTAVALLQGVNANALSADDFLDIENDIFDSRTGKQFSQSAQNQEDLQSQFTLHTISADGLKITDQNPDPKVGVFRGAIANLQTVSGQLLTDDDGNVLTDASGQALLNPNTPYVVESTLFEEGNLEAKLIYGSPIFDGRDVIQYTFFSEENGIRTNELVRFLDFWSVGDFSDEINDTDGFDDFPVRFLPSNFDALQAVNSIDYIFENGLLGLTEFVDPATNTPGSADIILRNEFEENLTYSSFTLASQSRSDRPKAQTIFDADILNADLTPSFGAARQGETIRVEGRKKKVKGTPGDDVIDASKARGKNKLIGKGGNDTLFSRKKDVLKGGSGADRLDARRGKARNKLKGGGGNDVLWAKKKDKLFGNGGSDRLDSSNAKGKNILKGGGGNDELLLGKNDRAKGGGGADIFWVAPGTLPSKAVVVQDFEDGIDLIGLNIAGLDPFTDLALIQQGTDVLLSVQGAAIALLQNTTTDQLTSEDFIDGTQTTLSVTDTFSQQEGKQYSQTATDEFNIESQFELTELTADGTPIVDTLPNDNRVALFPGAIRSFRSGEGSIRDTDGYTVREFDADGTAEFSVGVLKAELIDDPSQNAIFEFSGRDTIEYSILPAIGAEPVLRFRYDFTSEFASFDGFDLNQGINSLSYIAENNLLSQSFAVVQVLDSTVDTEDEFASTIGSTFNTKITQTYTKTERDIAQRSFLATQFSLVDRQGDAFVTDQDPLDTVGTYNGAIEDYVDNARLQSFSKGNLSANLNGNTVTYTLASEDASIVRSASLNLAGTGFDPNQSVNSLAYILENDILQRAFFSS